MSLDTIRHSASHIMADAVKQLFPGVKLGIGPSIEDGFYYDFDLPAGKTITEADLPKIEEKMAEIIKTNAKFESENVSKAEAEKRLEKDGETYKLELLSELNDGEVTFYKHGAFADLCRGPHVRYTKEVKAFKLLKVAGAYWRGSEKNKMLTRIYGTAFENKTALAEYLTRLEEASKRDHRKLGQQLDLFSTMDDYGAGLVLWHPNGARVRDAIETFWKQEHYKNGYDLLYTPHLGRSTLWETSGHLSFYKDSMYSPMSIDEDDYFIKPMNCPFHIQIYMKKSHSYRDLPLRWAELGTVYRYEKSGVLHGLMRVRGFTQDDAHIICTPEQIDSEISEVLKFSLSMWKAFGFKDVKAYLATRPADAVGEPARWDQAISALKKAVENEGLEYELDEGGGAFYGPKIDLKIKDAIGREWQMTTIQFDFNLPERFDMTYIAADGQKHRPYMVHRALLGSIERFFGVLVEHYAGDFPTWLAPVQARILTITDDQIPFGKEAVNLLRASGVRVELDSRGEKLGLKIREAELSKVPYMLVIGKNEVEKGAVSVRSRAKGDMGQVTLEDFVALINKEIAEKK